MSKRQRRLQGRLGKFLQQYARKKQKGQDPNDRSYSRDAEAKLKRLSPEEWEQVFQGDVEDQPDYIRAHLHSSGHRDEVMASERCGCFCCRTAFCPDEIVEWIDERNGVGQTAICPHCGVDAVVGSASGFPIVESLLARMKQFWFSIP